MFTVQDFLHSTIAPLYWHWRKHATILSKCWWRVHSFILTPTRAIFLWGRATSVGTIAAHSGYRHRWDSKWIKDFDRAVSLVRESHWLSSSTDAGSDQLFYLCLQFFTRLLTYHAAVNSFYSRCKVPTTWENAYIFFLWLTYLDLHLKQYKLSSTCFLNIYLNLWSQTDLCW